MKIVVVTNEKGGVGKTAISMNLAASAATTQRVLLIDADPQASVQDHLDVIQAQNPDFSVSFEFSPGWDPKDLENLRAMEDDFDLVIVDTPGSVENVQRFDILMAQTDLVLVPCTPEWNSIPTTVRLIKRINEKYQVPCKVVLNKVDPRVKGSEEEARERLATIGAGLDVMNSTLRIYRAYDQSFAAGELVATWDGVRSATKARLDLAALNAELAWVLSALPEVSVRA
jgi:chromosome partitioning protein